MAQNPKALLIILDGFGEGKDHPFNAIKNARMPFYRELYSKFPRAQLITCGEEVGLPPGVMGNSEVGHMNMAAGRIVYQELTRINKDIRENNFQKNPEINKTIDAAKKAGGRIHLLGLLSDAGVHAHIEHLKSLITLCSEKVPVLIHIFTDGRDTPPNSAEGYIQDLGRFIQGLPHVQIASIGGRYYGMDRDNRWDRVELAWKALTGQMQKRSIDSNKKGNGIEAALAIIADNYAKNITDEFISPQSISLDTDSGIVDGDAVIFTNFRGDRARELTRAFTEETFKEFNLGARPKLSRFLCFTQYDKKFNAPVAFLPTSLEEILPDVIAENGLSQFRIAETEKYAHVTFFFNGGRELIYPNEQRCLIPSPKDVATYDLKPEMSAPEVARGLADVLTNNKPNFALVNFANADMIGHTGNYNAAIKALECIDDCLEEVIKAALKSDYEIILTSDHGNIEEMVDDHERLHTQHTLNPVPIHYISKNPKAKKLQNGILSDIAPTILELMGLPKPKQMTAKSLLKL